MLNFTASSLFRGFSRNRHAAAAFAAFAALSLNATAQTGSVQSGMDSAQSAANASSQWGLGIGAAVLQRPYSGAEAKKRALPLVYYQNSWVRVYGNTADFKVMTLPAIAGSTVSLDARLRYEDNGYKAGDSTVFSGMSDRKDGFWGGGAVTWNTSLARATAAWTADVSGNSKGQKFEVQIDRRFSFGKLALTPRAQMQWSDKKYVDYYYGVRANEVLGTRIQYTGRDATSFEMGARLDYQLMPKHSIFLDVSAKSLPDSIKGSPLVARSSVSRVAAGYFYLF
jgi:outer membrane protein